MRPINGTSPNRIGYALLRRIPEISVSFSVTVPAVVATAIRRLPLPIKKIAMGPTKARVVFQIGDEK